MNIDANDAKEQTARCLSMISGFSFLQEETRNYFAEQLNSIGA